MFNICSINFTDNPKELQPRNIQISKCGKKLEIEWFHNNNTHNSIFDCQWLLNNSPNIITNSNTTDNFQFNQNENKRCEIDSIMNDIPKQTLWNNKCLDIHKNKLFVNYKDFINEHERLQAGDSGNSGNSGDYNYEAHLRLYENLFEFGFCFIDGIKPWNDIDTSRSLLEKIAPIRHTFFGDLYQFSSEIELSDSDYGDLAWSNEFLPPHTDTIYFTPGSGLQSFQCYSDYKTDFKGGKSTLTDGFSLLHDLKNEIPEVFDYFTKFKLNGLYLDKNELYLNDKQYVIGINGENNDDELNIEYFRFNNEDRANMSYLNFDDTYEFYKNYKILDEYVRNEKYQIQFYLEPGQLVIFNNWRVMHGRQTFSGKREMIGCYHEEQAWKSKYYNLKWKQLHH